MQIGRFNFVFLALVFLAFGGSKPESVSAPIAPIESNLDREAFNRISLRFDLNETPSGYQFRRSGEIIFSKKSGLDSSSHSPATRQCRLPVTLEFIGDIKAFNANTSEKLRITHEQLGIKNEKTPMDYRTSLFRWETDSLAASFRGSLGDLLTRYETKALPKRDQSQQFGPVALSSTGLGFALPLSKGFASSLAIRVALSPTDDAGTSPLCQHVIQNGWVVQTQ